MMPLDFILMLGMAYLLGALPWSVWLSVRATGVDPRTLTDGNPGTANAFRAAGRRVGIIVLALDFLKAFLPVAAARWILDLPDSQLFWIALAPMIGHAFSVFLRFCGGRGLTTIFGTWSGLTLYEAPAILGITALLTTQFIKNDELKTVLLPVILGGYLLLTGKPAWMIGLAVVQLVILSMKIGPFYLASTRQLRQTVHEDKV